MNIDTSLHFTWASNRYTSCAALHVAHGQSHVIAAHTLQLRIESTLLFPLNRAQSTHAGESGGSRFILTHFG